MAQLFAVLYRLTFPQRLQQQGRMIDHPLTARVAGRLVMLEPLPQLARR